MTHIFICPPEGVEHKMILSHRHTQGPTNTGDLTLLPLDVYLLCQPHTVLPGLKDFNVISMVVFNSIEFLSSE